MPSGHYLEPYGSKWSFSGCIRHFRVGRAQQHHISSQPISKNWFKEYVPKQTSQGTTLIRFTFKPEYITLLKYKFGTYRCQTTYFVTTPARTTCPVPASLYQASSACDRFYA